MEDNPYAPPQASHELAADIQQHRPYFLASRWTRLAAAILDFFFLALLIFSINFIIEVLGVSITGSASIDAENTIFNTPNALLNQFLDTAVSSTAYLIINGYLLVKFGQSLGKMICKIQIVSAHTQNRLSSGNVIGIRYVIPQLLNIIPGIGALFALIDILFIFGQSKRCLHDHMAGSIVIQKSVN